MNMYCQSLIVGSRHVPPVTLVWAEAVVPALFQFILLLSPLSSASAMAKP